MISKRLAATAAIIAFGLTGCQAAPVPGTGGVSERVPVRARSVSLGAANGPTLRLNVATPGGLRTQDLPKSLRNVHHFTAELWRYGSDAAAGAQVGPAVVLDQSNGYAAQFTDVPAGVFKMRVKAMATSDESKNITKDSGSGAYAESSNWAAITNGVVYYSDTSNGNSTLRATVPLLDGNLNNLVAGPIELKSPTTGAGKRTDALSSADKTGLALFNNGSRRSVPFPADVSNIFYLTDVQQGAHADAFGNPGGPTHEIWAYAADSSGLASPAFPTATAVSDTGAITGPITISFTAPNLSSGPKLAHAPTTNLAFDDAGRVYWYDGTSIRKEQGGVVTDAVTNPGGDTTGFTVNGAGTVFWADGTQLMQQPGGGGAATIAVPGGVGTGLNNATHLQVDEEGNLYWFNPGSGGRIMRAEASGTTWKTPETVASGIGTVTAMGVTAYGDIVFATNSYLYRLELDLAGVGYATFDSQSHLGAIGNITGLAVDRPGNIYFTDATSNKVMMMPAGGTAVYTVAGTGTATLADALAGTVPTAENLAAPMLVTVSRTGKLAFVSKGTNGTDLFLRRIQ